jgi:altronate hydrolase
VIVVGLGCEVTHLRDVLDGAQGETLVIQELGGTAAAVRAGIARVEAALPLANAVARRPVPASELKVALQCGGSDGYSGITANPALGAAVDLLVRNGGTAILSETTETYGAEHLLTRRAASAAVAEKLLARVAWWEQFAAGRGLRIDNNPSPGNKAGGLTTILEKSLGAVAKGGTTRLEEVVEYAEPVTARGLVFMDAPAFDPVGATAQVAGGANLICFTTGRGSVFGCKPVPSIKLATTTGLYRRMPDDMDVNCGTIVDGTETVAEAGERIFRLMLEVASGGRTRSEALGFGEEEFAPWDMGVML